MLISKVIGRTLTEVHLHSGLCFTHFMFLGKQYVSCRVILGDNIRFTNNDILANCGQFLGLISKNDASLPLSYER